MMTPGFHLPPSIKISSYVPDAIDNLNLSPREFLVDSKKKNKFKHLLVAILEPIIFLPAQAWRKH